MKNLVGIKICFLLLLLLSIYNCALAKLGDKPSESQKQYGKELVTKDFSSGNRIFSGKKVYSFPLYGWQIEAIYREGMSFSESVRPKGNKVQKQIITEREANVIADLVYPKKERGPYRKQVKNANFVSHFFEHGVISYEMQLSKARKHYVGVRGVRAVLYGNNEVFKDIMINAYH